MKIKEFLYFPFGVLILAICAGHAVSSTIKLDTDYRIRGMSYTNNDFDKTTSTDSVSFYGQRFSLSLTGDLKDGVEIGSKLTAIGVSGTTNTPVAVPYPNTSMTPYVEHAYLKITNFMDWPVSIIAGKQPLEYGRGLIVADNGIGYMAFRFMGNYDLTIPRIPYVLKETSLPLDGEIMTAKIEESLVPGFDHDLYGLLIGTKGEKIRYEFAFFEETDSGISDYYQGSNLFQTKSVIKDYYDFRIRREEEASTLEFEIAKQKGELHRIDGARINLEALAYVFYGQLNAEKTKLGKVSVHTEIAVFSGDDNPLLFDDDESFSPTFTRRYDGLERRGYGELFAATPYDAFFPMPKDSNYSGINVLNLGVNFSPVYAWLFGIEYYYFAASQGLEAYPKASGFERLYGAEYTLGVEMDLFVKFIHSKYVEAALHYARYTHPRFEVLWPKSDPASRYRFEISAKF
ncbi:MAG: hypothetical protein JW803_02655 [Endomicrobiales bacterium]|nr:hypothetical protein [Endomicrobiales bacterium]